MPRLRSLAEWWHAAGLETKSGRWAVPAGDLHGGRPGGLPEMKPAKVGHGDNARPNHCLIYVPLIELGEVRCSSVLTKWDAHQSIHAGCGKNLMESGVNMMETDWNGRGCECPARFGRNL